MIQYKYIFPSRDETGDTLYTYDRMGRLTCTDDSEGNTVSYTYDEAGNVSGITYPDGGVISYKYDKNNNLISVKDATGKETRYSYDALDRVTLTERPNNINTAFAYDGEGHVTRLVNYDSFTGLTISCYAYTYDAAGFITKERAAEYLTEMPFMTADPLTGGSLLMPYGWGRMNRSLADSLKLKNGGMLPAVTKNTRYTYDEDGKLVRAVEDGWRKAGIEYIYEYDAKGNRTYYEKREAGISAEKVESTYDKADRLISAIETSISDSGKVTQNTWSYTYDGDGNLISEECDDGTVREDAFTYVYEAEDRLKAVYDPEGLVAAYTYDGDGNRVLELSYDTELKGNLNNKDFTTVNAAEVALEEYLGDEERGLYEITRYINDVNREYTQVLMERDGSGALSTAYVYGNERLSVRSTKKESGYYLYDGRGSVTGIVSILGERLESYGYDPSGQAMRATSTNRYQKTFYGYNAESYDPKTGSVYLRARYYNTRTGSFSTKDTYLGELMDPLSRNRYAYTQGNPVNYQDPSGHGTFASDDNIAVHLGLDDIVKRKKKEISVVSKAFKNRISGASERLGYTTSLTNRYSLRWKLRLAFMRSDEFGCGSTSEYSVTDLAAKYIIKSGVFTVDYVGALQVGDTNEAPYAWGDPGTLDYEPADYTDAINDFLIQMILDASAEDFADIFEKYIYFKNRMNTDADYDIKRNDQWNKQITGVPFPEDKYFLYDGVLMKAAELGNIAYGFLGAFLGIPLELLYYGGGYANKGKWMLPTLPFRENFGDQPEDIVDITFGYKLFYDVFFGGF